MMPTPRLKPKRRHERARQYAVIAERLQFHLDAGSLPADVAELVRQAKDLLMTASDRLDATPAYRHESDRESV
jgi:hypothetical protein